MITRDAWVVKYVDGSFYGSNTFEKAKLFNRKGRPRTRRTIHDIFGLSGKHAR